MSLISIKNLNFTHEGNAEAVFENLSIVLDSSWKTGFIGRNGRGKTTLLKLLAGEYKYTGTISASVNFDYFPPKIKEVEKNALETAQKFGIEQWQLEKEVSLLGLDKEILTRAFKTLSGGEQTKVMLAILFLKENSFLLLDEPTNHLDFKAAQTISWYLKRKKGFILVSHDRSFLDECVDHILSINKTGMEICRGNFSSWQQNKEQKDSFESAQNIKLAKDIRRLEAAAKETAKWSNKTEQGKYHIDKGSGAALDKGFIGHKSAKLMQRSKNAQNLRSKAIDEKSKLLKDLEYASELKLSFLDYPNKRLIETVNLTLFRRGCTVIDKLNFTIESGERIWLKGINGCGKSTLLKFILGENIAHAGQIYMPHNLKISYVPQDTSALNGSLKEFAKISQIDESLFKTILRKLDFSREQFDKEMSGFSNGQKKKVFIAKSLCESAHIYIWDEPLNFIDLLSRIQIENLLLKYRPAMLFTEHDKTFAQKIATKIVNLSE
ncbi:MAG: ABC-F type ribosomal protection protein [Campylobacteraceae bacterium]|jgi:lincosamide and streptogramin A transport system ATP-binding/permease protein|nr:ABC-F type ribosomal protection protein [Campylobacteraceae bacterium]